MSLLLAAMIIFVASHELLSHPLRRPLVNAIGVRPFMALYSLVAFATGSLAVWAFARAPVEVLWIAPAIVLQLAAPLMVVASILFVGSLLDANPALPGADGRLTSAPEPRGVLRITRHPMMWGFALWAIVHIIIAGTSRGVVFAMGILVLSLFGAAMQDRKKQALLGDSWTAWRARTAFVPFAAQLDGRQPVSSLWPGRRAAIYGCFFFLGAMGAHLYFGAPVKALWDTL